MADELVNMGRLSFERGLAVLDIYAPLKFVIFHSMESAKKANYNVFTGYVPKNWLFYDKKFERKENKICLELKIEQTIIPSDSTAAFLSGWYYAPKFYGDSEQIIITAIFLKKSENLGVRNVFIDRIEEIIVPRKKEVSLIKPESWRPIYARRIAKPFFG